MENNDPVSETFFNTNKGKFILEESEQPQYLQAILRNPPTHNS